MDVPKCLEEAKELYKKISEQNTIYSDRKRRKLIVNKLCDAYMNIFRIKIIEPDSDAIERLINETYTELSFIYEDNENIGKFLNLLDILLDNYHRTSDLRRDDENKEAKYRNTDPFFTDERRTSSMDEYYMLHANIYKFFCQVVMGKDNILNRLSLDYPHMKEIETETLKCLRTRIDRIIYVENQEPYPDITGIMKAKQFMDDQHAELLYFIEDYRRKALRIRDLLIKFCKKDYGPSYYDLYDLLKDYDAEDSDADSHISYDGIHDEYTSVYDDW